MNQFLSNSAKASNRWPRGAKILGELVFESGRKHHPEGYQNPRNQNNIQRPAPRYPETTPDSGVAMADASRAIDLEYPDDLLGENRTVTVEEEFERIRVAAANIQTHRHECHVRRPRSEEIGRHGSASAESHASASL